MRRIAEPTLSPSATVLLSVATTAMICGASLQIPMALGVGASLAVLLLVVWSWTVAELMILDRDLPVAPWPAVSQYRAVGDVWETEVQVRVPAAWRGIRVSLAAVACDGVGVQWPGTPVVLHAAEMTLRVSARAERVGCWAVPGVALRGCGPLGLVRWDRRARSGGVVRVLPSPWLRRLRARTREASGVDGGAPPPRTRPGRGLEEHDLRPWQPGDAPRDVAWPASLRTGALWVRRRARDERTPLWIVLELTPKLVSAASEQRYTRVLDVIAALYRQAEADERPCGWILVEDEHARSIPIGTGRRREVQWAERFLALGNSATCLPMDAAPDAMRHAVAEDVEAWDRLHFQRSESEGLTQGLDAWMRHLERRWPPEAQEVAGWPPKHLPAVARYTLRWGMPFLARPLRRPGSRHRALAAALSAMSDVRGRLSAEVVWLGERPAIHRKPAAISGQRWTWGLLPLQPWAEVPDDAACEEDVVRWLQHVEEREELGVRARALRAEGYDAHVIDPNRAPDYIAAMLLAAPCRRSRGPQGQSAAPESLVASADALMDAAVAERRKLRK